MAIEKKISISLDGTVYKNIISFTLKEQVGDHTKFGVSIRARALENTLEGITIIESSRSFLGQSFSLMIEGDESLNYENLNFSGTVTNVRGRKGKERGGLGDVIELEGMSNTILLNGAKHTLSFLETNLSEVISEITSPFGVTMEVAPTNDPVLSYTVQSKQNTFEYLQYLAATNGEYLIYNRDTLYFGTPTIGETITLMYGKDLIDFSLGLAVEPLNFDFYNHDYFAESETKVPSTAASTSTSGYTAFATNQSTNLFQNLSEQIFPTFEDAELDRRMNEAITIQKKVAEQKQVSVQGESTNTGITLGKIIEIKSAEDSFGTYRITEVNHSYSLKGKYKNTFTAIPMEVDIYPLTDVTKINIGQSEIAVVTDTTDPEGMSRIQVQFPWQVASGQFSPWIRLVTPYAGSEKGFHFIPEIGESVLIAYEQGNIERPYIMGALYTGQNKSDEWQTDANNVKAIRTRSGHTIELNDTEGEEKINIYDNEGSVITFDTVEKSLIITATENIDITAKNINITAEENITVGAQGDIEIAAEGDLTALAEGDLNLQSTGDTAINSSSNVAIEATSNSSLEGMNTTVKAKSKAELTGMISKVTASTLTMVSGTPVKIN